MLMQFTRRCHAIVPCLLEDITILPENIFGLNVLGQHTSINFIILPRLKIYFTSILGAFSKQYKIKKREDSQISTSY